MEHTDASFEAAAESCARGELKFDRFFNAHLHMWEGIARAVMRKWKSPAEVDDVLQEIRIRVWKKIPLFDRSRGKLWRDFLSFQARDAAKTWVHAERGANKHGTRDKNLSRRFAPVSSLAKDGDDDRLDRWDVPVEPTQEDEANAASVAAACTLSQDRRILEAMIAARGCVDTVAQQLYGNLDVEIARKLILGSLVVVGLATSSAKERAA